MKIMKVIVLALALALGSVVYAAADMQSSTRKCTASASCCKDSNACQVNLSCCEQNDAKQNQVATPTQPATQESKSEEQTAKVILSDKGYEPASLKLKPDIPARITFLRQTDTTCGTEIVIPEYGIKTKLPLNKEVVVELTPKKSGEFEFTCGMGMLRGKIVVQ
jgi:hypothetical protein